MALILTASAEPKARTRGRPAQGGDGRAKQREGEVKGKR